MQLVFEAPSKDSPGFLKRLKRAMRFQDEIKSGKFNERTIDDMIDFLVEYIKEVPPDKAKEYLLDASEAQFMDMLDAITTNNTEQQTEKNV